MTNPCYDKHTKTDCPKRKPGCAGSCEKWAEYVKIRDAAYRERAKAHTIETFNEAKEQRKIKYKLRNRPNYKKHD